MQRAVWLQLALIGCAHHVSQDRTTGPDGVIEGATRIELVDNVARARGTISYPDGDRVDWFDVALPANGDIDVEVKWRGKRAAIELWDDDYVRVAAERPGTAAVHRVHGESLAKHAYVRIYAPGLADAGSYELVVTFKPGFPALAATGAIDWANEDIPPPPRMPYHEHSRCAVFDAKDPACHGVCNPDAPDDLCRVCPSPPDPARPACQATMPCPNPPDRRVRACLRPRCEGENCLDVDELMGRILDVDEAGGETVVVIGIGTAQGVEKTWRAFVLAGESGTALANGELALVRVERAIAVAKSKLTKAQIQANPRVKLQRR